MLMRRKEIWIVIAFTPTETEINVLMSKIPGQQVVIVEVDANAKIGLEKQSDVLGKWHYLAERRSHNGDRLVDLCEQTGLIIASTFERNHRRHQRTWQGSTFLDEMKSLKPQLDSVGHPKTRAVWNVVFDFDHHLLSFIRLHNRNRKVPLQTKIDMAGLKDEECRTNIRQLVYIHAGERTRKKLCNADFFTKCIQDADIPCIAR
ncbi:hypothetical protein RB195_005835 [Necator americanus]|uniref:Uncharacterized protein n=1 Tax=Necator americanus TaxID=51031 RepID=A0ABR1BRC0_NECAM